MISTGGHWFWWLLTIAAIAWYTLITGYVAARGVLDIKRMLRALAQKATED